MQNLRMVQAFNNCLQHRLSVANGIFIMSQRQEAGTLSSNFPTGLMELFSKRQ